MVEIVKKIKERMMEICTGNINWHKLTEQVDAMENNKIVIAWVNPKKMQLLSTSVELLSVERCLQLADSSYDELKKEIKKQQSTLSDKKVQNHIDNCTPACQDALNSLLNKKV